MTSPSLTGCVAGSECTLCGSDLVCHDTRQPLDSLLLLNGRPGLHLTFQSNTGGRGCGFRLLATCVRRTFFESSNCSVPEPLPPPTLPTPFPPNFSKRVSMCCLDQLWLLSQERVSIVSSSHYIHQTLPYMSPRPHTGLVWYVYVYWHW